jgi:2,4-dienoyl-CoA reductase-like NADH-dependent reductase (Old Yellow Enzyme family)
VTDAPATYPRLFEPIAIGPLQLRNRIMMTVHGGLRAERNVRYYEDKAAGGVGLMCVPGGSVGVQSFAAAPGRFLPQHVDDFGGIGPDPTSPEGVAFFDDRVIPTMRSLADAAHRHGTVVLTQIYHLGAARVSGEPVPTIAPSAVRDDEDRTNPHVLADDEIATLATAFGHSARRAREAGLDGVELHGAHGYLINQFLSGYTNRRTDAYGGSPENRMRFLQDILAEVDRLAGPDFPVGLRINADEGVEGGLTVEEVVAVAETLAPRLMYLSVSAGTTTGLKHGVGLPYASPWLVENGHNAPLAAAVRRGVSVPVVVAGRIQDPDHAEQLLADGACDIVGMARALLADPQWPTKVREGRRADIRPCISNNDCHGRGHMMCAVNPVATRETEMETGPAQPARDVLVVGGGPAGMEAARVAAARGHRVVLCEREKVLGGQVRIMAEDPGRYRLPLWLDYQQRQLALEGVDVRLDTELDERSIRGLSPDVVVLATGARPAVPAIPGIDSPHVTTAESVLLGSAPVGSRVVVLGALEDHMRPLTLADLLAGRGHEVTLVSELLVIGQGVEKRTQHLLLQRLVRAGVHLRPMTEVTAVDGPRLRTRDVVTDRAGIIEDVDTVVLANGGAAVDGLRAPLREEGREVHLIGDCLSPRQILHAILDGARIGRAL